MDVEFDPAGLQIMCLDYATVLERTELRRAEPRVEVTAEWIYRCEQAAAIEIDLPKHGAHETLRKIIGGDWWKGATLRTVCDGGVQGGRVLYRFVDKDFARHTYRLQWAD